MFLTTALLIAAAQWTMACGGDIMLNGIAPARDALADVAPIFKEANIAYANLEIPLTTATTATKRKTPDEVRRRQQFILKANVGHIATIKKCGFDFVSLGNNHGMDYGHAGLKQMQDLLIAAGIDHSGGGKNLADAERVAIARVGDLRVGMISYLAFMSTASLHKNTPATASSPGVAALFFEGDVDASDRATIASIVRNAKQKCEMLFVALHWGIERATTPSRYQLELGRAFVDAGADGILGAHPHVLQGYEMYRGKPILYSMGNLVSPLSGETAIFRLRFQDRRCTAIETIPCGISGGKVRPHTGATANSQNARIAALCKKIPSNK